MSGPPAPGPAHQGDRGRAAASGGHPSAGGPHDPADPAGPGEGDRLGTALSLTVAFTAVIGLATTIVWAAAGSGYYWPRWVWLGGVGAVAPLVVVAHARTLAAGARRWLVLHADVGAAVSLYLLLIWCFAGASGSWPVWPVLSLALLLATHALLFSRHLLPPFGRARRLSERVETLTRSRAGALDAQAAQLRRIERDLHDGAQARLVALSMHLGRAEARLAGDPGAAALVKAAREEAGAVIAELRNLARGIAPPVLADRGLAAAVQSLADRAPTTVTVAVDQVDRLAPVVESAAYFVVAEALTNVAKHAPGVAACVSMTRRDGRLVLDVADDGPGGADPSGGGLAGLRARVEALDGTFTVSSPAKGPTVVHAELPCGS